MKLGPSNYVLFKIVSIMAKQSVNNLLAQSKLYNDLSKMLGNNAMHKHDTSKGYNLPLISLQTNTVVNVTVKLMPLNIFSEYSS